MVSSKELENISEICESLTKLNMDEYLEKILALLKKINKKD